MLKIFCAGVAGKVTGEILQLFKNEYPGENVTFERGGSMAGVNRTLSGECFDVMILADNSNIDQILIPDYADGYYIWGGNSMVIMGKGLNAENWTEKLFEKGTVIRHMNPYDDPSGYRAVMSMKLADKYRKGLTEKLISHPGYNGLDRELYKGPFKMLAEEDNDSSVCLLVYKSLAVAQGKDYAELPSVMNLGDPEFEEEYNKATFVVDGGEEIKGTTIYHAVLIPSCAQNRESAERFVRLFLETDFTKYGFTDIHRPVGNWNI